MQLLKRRFGPFVVCLVLVVAGCAVWRQATQEQPLRFSHEKMLHQSVECADCHTQTSTSDKAGMPVAETCLDCHEDIDKNKPPERHVATMFENGQFKAAKVTAISEEVIFSHKLHTVDKKMACAECHKGMAENQGVTKDLHISMQNCIDCHAKTVKVDRLAGMPSKPAEDCATCHREIRKDVKPTTHKQNWTEFHGQKAKDGDQEGLNQCSLCHTQDSCNSCHKTTQPKNHNNQWRQRGHGVVASIDRDGCSTCHESDTCTSCHKTTAPRSHTGQFGDGKSKHCTGCHFPVANEGCAVCHTEGTPSHAKATPTPATMRGTDCRSCHGVAPAAKMPHVDNGNDCNYCHH